MKEFYGKIIKNVQKLWSFYTIFDEKFDKK
jgi:hypothetical protein